MTTNPMDALTVIQSVTPPFLPADAEVMTVVIEWPPGDPGAPPTATPADRRSATCWKAKCCSS